MPFDWGQAIVQIINTGLILTAGYGAIVAFLKSWDTKNREKSTGATKLKEIEAEFQQFSRKVQSLENQVQEIYLKEVRELKDDLKEIRSLIQKAFFESKLHD